MKIVIKEKVIPYILISLFSSIGLSAYGYKAEGQGGSKAVVWSISKIDTMQKNVQRNDERNPISKKCFGKKLSMKYPKI